MKFRFSCIKFAPGGTSREILNYIPAKKILFLDYQVSFTVAEF